MIEESNYVMMTFLWLVNDNLWIDPILDNFAFERLE